MMVMLISWSIDSSTISWTRDLFDGEIRDISISVDGKSVVIASGENVYLVDKDNNSIWNFWKLVMIICCRNFCRW